MRPNAVTKRTKEAQRTGERKRKDQERAGLKNLKILRESRGIEK